MDFYHIGAMKVFSQLGQLIEEDEHNQIKFSDLPIDIMQKIGSCLLEDKNKTIHKIFKDRKDDDLQVLLFGEVKDLTYVNIHDCHNEIDYEMNDKIKNYVNFVLKAKGIKNTCQKMRVKFYLEPTYIIGCNKSLKERVSDGYKDTRIIKIKFYDEKGDEIAEISLNQYHQKFTYPLPINSILVEYRLKYFYNNDTHKWINQSVAQTIQKNDIIKEYKTIREEIINKYF
jgi:hypothetical protein